MTASAPARERLDAALHRRGLAASRARARAMIEAGAVRVDGVVVHKPAAQVAADAEIAAEDPCPWVSRGALKLIGALDGFGLSPAGMRVLDVGASTGGFTEVCLARGAAAAAALDVGRGQLHPKLRADPRVLNLEGRNARDLTADALPWRPEWIVADLSFISLAKGLGPALRLAAPEATLIALIKPQFEVGRPRIGKGGVVRDPEARRDAVTAAAGWIARQGWRILAEAPSPIAGGDGNIEHLIAARGPAAAPEDAR